MTRPHLGTESMTSPNDVAALVERLRNRNERYQAGMGNPLYYIGSDAILDCDAAATIAALQAEVERDIEDAVQRAIYEGMRWVASHPRSEDFSPPPWDRALGTVAQMRATNLARSALASARSASRKETTP